jgi:hypothetical protein
MNTPFKLVEINTLPLPSPSHSFNSLRLCLDPNENFALLSTSVHTGKLAPSNVTAFQLSVTDLTPKPKKKKHRSVPSPPLPPYTESVVASDVIGGNGVEWEKVRMDCEECIGGAYFLSDVM